MERYKFRKLPEAWETPVPLTDLSIASRPHRESSFCGYQFELPWDDVDERKSKTVGSIQLTAFRSMNGLWFSCFPRKSFVNEVIKNMKLDPVAFGRTYGAASESDYNFYRMMLAVTPGSFTLFTPRQQFGRESSLLVLKAIAMPPTDSGIFLVQTGRFRGFQFGAPQRRPSKITDELYTDDGGIELIFFQDQHSSAPAISQAEINRVVQSVRKASDGPTKHDQ